MGRKWTEVVIFKGFLKMKFSQSSHGEKNRLLLLFVAASLICFAVFANYSLQFIKSAPVMLSSACSDGVLEAAASAAPHGTTIINQRKEAKCSELFVFLRKILAVFWFMPIASFVLSFISFFVVDAPSKYRWLLSISCMFVAFAPIFGGEIRLQN
jgi:hypothetical protein